MYAGCNGKTCVYTCCIKFRVHICGKILFLALRTAKKGLQVYIGKWKKAFSKKLHRVRKIFL
jgi:hypothetical protein